MLFISLATMGQAADEFEPAQTALDEARTLSQDAKQEATTATASAAAVGEVVEALSARVDFLEQATPGPSASWYVTPRMAPVPGIPDDHLDDTAALQWCFAFDGHHRPVYLEPGRYRISETLRTYRKIGITVIGAGVKLNVREHPNHYGTSSVIEWRGADNASDEPVAMWWFGGAGGLITGLTFDGRNIADIGFLSHHPQGMNPTKTEIGFWSMQRMRDVGWQFGDSVHELGNDNLHANYLHARDCQWMYRLATEQAMGHTIDKFLSKTQGVFDVLAGGRLSVGSGDVPNAAKTFLRIPPGGAVGSSNGSLWFHDIGFDARAVGIKLVDMQERKGPRISFDGIHCVGWLPEKTITLRQWGSLTLRNTVGILRPGALYVAETGPAGVNVHVSRSQARMMLTAEEFLSDDSVDNRYHIEMEDNFIWDGQKVPDSEVSRW
jgi:hypothetical protein